MDADQSFVRGYGASSSVTHDQVPSFGQEEDVRKGPWTVEEDSTLMECINTHGEGRWNSLAGRSGLKRSGKSCRLRWLNYLRPNVRRGNITLEEQLLILQLHCRWGNRWSKIAESLPGRTDNEIKNYWRTRVQKQAKQFNCDVNSKQFQDKMNYVWIPRIMERIRASSNPSISDRPTATATATATATPSDDYCLSDHSISAAAVSSQLRVDHNFVPEISSSTSEFEVCLDYQYPEFKCSPNYGSDLYCFGPDIRDFEQVETSNSRSTPGGDFGPDIRDFEQVETSNSWSTPGGDLVENLWNEENIWFLQQQLNSDI